MSAIEAAYHTVKDGIESVYNEAGKFLDKNPTLYKVVLVVSHFFRSAAMFGLMMWLPIPTPITATAMVGGTLLYRAAVERFCCFRFAIPSMVGAGAAWLAKIAVVNFVSGAAFSSLGMTIANALAFLPLLCYTAWVVYLSHADIEKRMQQLQLEKKADCCACAV